MLDCVLASMEMLSFVEKQRAEAISRGEEAWGMRCVLHSGSIVSGVVGHSMIAFDIWGFAVNIAARIETIATEGQITISEAVYHRIRDYFDAEYVGEQELKQVGCRKVYAISGFKKRLRLEKEKPLVPNHVFGQIYGHVKAGNHVTYTDGKYRVYVRKTSPVLASSN